MKRPDGNSKSNDDLGQPASLAALGRALRRRRAALQLTLDDLMQKTAISKPYLSNIETGRAPGPPSPEKLRRIAKALGMDPRRLLAAADWLRTPESVRRLLTGQLPSPANDPPEVPRRADGAIDLDAMTSPPADRPSRTTLPDERIPVRDVPLINRVAAGRASEYTDLDYPRGVADAYVPAPDLPELPVASAFALKVIGDSMMPEYADGDLIIVGPRPGEEPIKDGEDCVVRLSEADNFANTFKRVFFVRDESGAAMGLRLVPLNPAHAERTVRLEEVSGIYPLMYRLMSPRGKGQAGG